MPSLLTLIKHFNYTLQSLNLTRPNYLLETRSHWKYSFCFCADSRVHCFSIVSLAASRRCSGPQFESARLEETHTAWRRHTHRLEETHTHRLEETHTPPGGDTHTAWRRHTFLSLERWTYKVDGHILTRCDGMNKSRSLMSVHVDVVIHTCPSMVLKGVPSPCPWAPPHPPSPGLEPSSCPASSWVTCRLQPARSPGPSACLPPGWSPGLRYTPQV